VGELAALIAALTWSATSVALTSLSTRTSPVVLSALRLGSATLLMPFILLASGQTGDLADAPVWTLFQVIASGFIGYGLGDTIYILGLKRLGMQRTFPVTMALFIGLTVLGGVVLLGEPFTWGLPAGALFIGAGIYLIVIPQSAGAITHPPVPVAEPAAAALAPVPVSNAGPAVFGAPGITGYALLLTVGVLWAAATLWLASAKGDLGAVAAGAIRTPAGAVALLGFALAFQPHELKTPFRNRGHILAIVAAGIVGTAFGSLMYVYAVVTAGAAKTAVLSATSPLLALPLSIIFLKERITRRIGAGTILCVIGIVLVVL
jgi:drug/metabolite transporter, DME family